MVPFPKALLLGAAAGLTTVVALTSGGVSVFPSPGSFTSASIAGSSLVEAAEAQCDPQRARINPRGWRTDFSKCSVPLDEFQSGGPGKDGIPPIDNPKFETVSQASGWLKDREPVIYVEMEGDAAAYPIQVLIWHEIVNDVIGGVPASVTFCPLCNTAIVFDRRLSGLVLDFGTTGSLRHSDLVMWDRQTESWWQQASGEALVGELTGARLTMLPASLIAWEEFRQRRPGGRVLSRDTGFRREYGRNPYVGYDAIDQSPFLFRGSTDGRLRPMERVVTISLGGENVAYPFPQLKDAGLIADSVGGVPLVVFYDPGTASALDSGSIANSREVGSSAVYQRAVDGQVLTFAWNGDMFFDLETGSRWTFLGEAVDGPLAGKRLTPVVHMDAFWFASAAFFPQIRLWSP